MGGTLASLRTRLNPSVQIRFKNAEWSNWINTVVIPAVREGLGVTAKDVVAQIYKLLVYETGSQYVHS